MILTLYEPFRHWSETGSVYILSDPHFGDSDCKLMDPGWIEPEEQVARINAVVMKNDTFVCLGDVGQASFVKQIKARKKILLLGNHDKKKDYKGLFDEIYDGPLLIAEKILLSHEPVYGLPWCLNIHGHDHSNIEPYKIGCKHLNLAANVCGYIPVSLGKLIKEGILSTTIYLWLISLTAGKELSILLLKLYNDGAMVNRILSWTSRPYVRLITSSSFAAFVLCRLNRHRCIRVTPQ